MSERIAEAFWIAVLLLCVFSADQVSRAQPTSDKDEKSECGDQTKYSYEVDGTRYYVPYEVIDGQDVIEGDIVIGDAQGSGYFPPTVPPFVNGQARRWPG